MSETPILVSRDFTAARVAAAKAGRRVSVVLPARNEAATVGTIVRTIRAELMGAVPVVDELVVIDDRSTDATASIAAEAGASVVSSPTVAPELQLSGGKGEALWKSLLVTSGDVVCWCDADVLDFRSEFVLGLVGPLLEQPGSQFAKGWYERPVAPTGEVPPTDESSPQPPPSPGGRVTELLARPLITLLYPHLDHIIQPLSGEFAAKRSAVEQVPFHRSYAVDLGLLLDIGDRFGVESILQVDLGTRSHTRQDLLALGGQATMIAAMLLRRAGLDQPDDSVTLRQPGGTERVIQLGELPSVSDYRRGLITR